MEKQLALAKALTDLLENKFRIGKFKFGLDPILGAIPLLGDWLTTSLSLYIVWIAYKMQVPNDKIYKMLGNIFVDYLIGLFPIIGDLSDIVYKSNSKNLKIIEEFSSKVIQGKIIE